MPRPSTDALAPHIGLISGSELASFLGYSGPNDAFRKFCMGLGIQTVPGRPGWYYPPHVKERLDLVHGIGARADTPPHLSLVERRRARNGTL